MSSENSMAGDANQPAHLAEVSPPHEIAVGIQRVYDGVAILLQASCKNYNVIPTRHLERRRWQVCACV